MSGIFGVVYRDPRARADRGRLLAARNALALRRPIDDAGIWLYDGVALAQHQPPAVTRDQRYVLACHGQVYNSRDFQIHFAASPTSSIDAIDGVSGVASGNISGGTSGGGVFDALIHEHAAALDRFNGAFALAFWDQQQRRLLLARDHLGEKSLYWFADDDLLVFASQLGVILEYLDRRFPVDPAALEQFFTQGYVLAPRTIFSKIQKLSAGSLLRLDAQRWDLAVKPWWDVTLRPTPDQPAKVVDELDELLTDAVRLRLGGDAPAGCLLSGGVDSALVTAIAAKVSGPGLTALTAGIQDVPHYDDSALAQLVAQRHACNWSHDPLPDGDSPATLESALADFDEPLGHLNAVPMHQIARMAQSLMPVALTGLGADEIAAGHPGRYNWTLPTKSPNLQKYAAPVDALNDHLAHTRALPWVNGLDRILSEPLRQSFIQHSDPLCGIGEHWYRFRNVGRLPNMLYADVKTHLPDNLLCLQERAAASCGLETRSPFLDHRVVSFMLSLPVYMHFRDDKNKWPLLELAHRYLPAQAIIPPRQGLAPRMPVRMQSHAGPIARVFASLEPQLRPLFADDWWRHLCSAQYDSRTTTGDYYSLVLALWFQKYARYIASWPVDAAGGLPRISSPSPSGKGQGEGCAPGHLEISPLEISTASQTEFHFSDKPGPSTPAPHTPRSLDSLLIPDSPATSYAFCADISGGAEAGQFHRVYRVQDPVACVKARWFCQTLTNFPAEITLRVEGQDADFHRFLARQWARHVSDQAPAQGLIIVGIGHVLRLCPAILAPDQLAPGATVLLFVTARSEQAQDVDRLLAAVKLWARVAGFQPLAISPSEALLIIKLTTFPAVALPPTLEFSKPRNNEPFRILI